jgi:outer membrane protein OmpA-like peptidoglycan-associated protein
MAFAFTGMTQNLARAAAIAAVAFGASACSMVPDWMGGSSTPPATADDQADQQATADTSSPDLNSVPDKPTAPSTADQQKALSDSLGADRSQNQYSADQLRGGTEAAAAPPGAPPPDQVADTSGPSQPAAAPPPDQSAPDQSSDTAAPAVVPPAPAAAAPPSDSGSSDTAAIGSGADQAPPPAVPPAPATTADTAAVPAVRDSAPVQQTAISAPPPAVSSGSEPAVPAVPDTQSSYAPNMMNPTDAELGFKPSTAPPLSPTVAQFVPQPIIARYQQTAAMGRAPGIEGSYSAPTKATGGPEQMSGAVVANFDSLQPGAYAPSDAYGGAPSAVVMFAGDRTILDVQAKQQVRAAASAFQQSGGQGFVRVVGHSASGGNLSSQRLMVLNFEHSQARATAVARELIKDGVPADKVLVETAGGADSSASAEIFLQS